MCVNLRRDREVLDIGGAARAAALAAGGPDSLEAISLLGPISQTHAAQDNYTAANAAATEHAERAARVLGIDSVELQVALGHLATIATSAFHVNAAIATAEQVSARVGVCMCM